MILAITQKMIIMICIYRKVFKINELEELNYTRLREATTAGGSSQDKVLT